MSVGLYDFNVEFISGGNSVTVNGAELRGPARVLRNGFVRETSIVPLGADSNTNAAFFSAHSSRFNNQETPMSDEKVRELEAKVAQLTADSAAAQELAEQSEARAAAAEAKLAEQSATIRKNEVKEVFKATGREYTEEAASAYVAMSAETWAVVKKDLSNAKPVPPGAPSYLFGEQATDKGGDSGQGAVTLSASEVYSKRR